MTSRRRRGRRVAEEQTSYVVEPSLPSFASTPEQIQKAVERNSIQRGVFFLNQLHAQNFHALVQRVEELIEGYDELEWQRQAMAWGIDPGAIQILDNAKPPAHYPYYFCNPHILATAPPLIKYYRNVAMISQKVMGDMGLNTALYEAGAAVPDDVAEALARRFNEIISALIIQARVTPERHLEMAYSNLGDSLGGAWRNEVGRLAYVEVLTPLILHLHQRNCLDYIAYSLKGSIVQEDQEATEEDPQPVGVILRLVVDEHVNVASVLAQWKQARVVYSEIGLRNGNRLLLNRQLRWPDPEGGTPWKLGPDLLSASDSNPILWGGELKGGADPAGSDEHWKTATQAFNRILLACEKTGREKPPLSFIATILVDRVAREAEEWIRTGKLTSVYNLTQIAEDPAKQEEFLSDLAAFLECSADYQPAGV